MHAADRESQIPAPPSATSRARFVLFGWARVIPPEIVSWARAHGAELLRMDFGRAGSTFAISTYPDIALTHGALCVTAGRMGDGHLRTLTAEILLARGLATPHRIAAESLHGSFLTCCLSRTEPAFSAYRSVPSNMMLYYWERDDIVLFSDTLRVLIAFAKPLELNQDALLHHLIYRNTTGSMTHYRNIKKLISGHAALFADGALRLRQERRFADLIPGKQIVQPSDAFVDAFEERTSALVGAYLRAAENAARSPVMLLSGGVDSSLLTSFAQEQLPQGSGCRSATYAVHAPSFADEIEYARDASRRLDTQHDFVEVGAEDYPRLLIEATRICGQPIDHEQDPCYLALAHAFAGQPVTFLSGSGADTLLGHGGDKHLLYVDRYRAIPGVAPLLEAGGRWLRGSMPDKAHGMRVVAELLRRAKQPLHPQYPPNYGCTFSNLDVILRSFDSQTIAAAMSFRMDLCALYWPTASITEQTHLVELLLDMEDEEAHIVQVFRSYDLDFVEPFMDSMFAAASLELDWRVRYYHRGIPKWLPTTLLSRRTGSALAQKPKRAGGFDQELFGWMREGVLRDLVLDIERPGFLSIADFERQMSQPDWLTWNLLTLDIFQKQILRRAADDGEAGLAAREVGK